MEKRENVVQSAFTPFRWSNMYLCVLNAQQVYNMHTCKPICKKHHGRRVPLHWEAILCLCLPVPIILTFMFVENIFFSIYDLISSKTTSLHDLGVWPWGIPTRGSQWVSCGASYVEASTWENILGSILSFREHSQRQAAIDAAITRAYRSYKVT